MHATLQGGINSGNRARKTRRTVVIDDQIDALSVLQINLAGVAPTVAARNCGSVHPLTTLMVDQSRARPSVSEVILEISVFFIPVRVIAIIPRLSAARAFATGNPLPIATLETLEPLSTLCIAVAFAGACLQVLGFCVLTSG